MRSQHQILFAAFAVAALILPAPIAVAAPIENGGFETGDLTDWAKQSSGGGAWSVYNGTTSPISGYEVAPPPEGAFAAIADQNGPGSHLLLHDITVPSSGDKTLSMLVYYEDRAGNISAPDTLAYNGSANQQFRVDLLQPGAAADSLASSDIAATLFATRPGDPLSLPYTRVCYDLSALTTPNATLRAALVDNEYYFQAAIDDVRVGDGCPAAPPPPPAPVADLAIANFTGPASLTQGEDGKFEVEVMDLGPSHVSSVHVDVAVDGSPTAFGEFVGDLAPGASVSFSAVLAFDEPGEHTLAATIVERTNDSDPDLSNNVANVTIVVTPRPEVSVAILRLDPVYIPTDVGPVRDPRGRFDATIQECNDGGVSSDGGVALSVEAGSNATSGVGSSSVGSVSVPPLENGACATQNVTFDTPGVIGDFTLVANLSVKLDGPSGNIARASSFHLVGDQGGVVLPAGATVPISPSDPLGVVLRNATSAQGTATAAINTAVAAANAATRTLANDTASIERTASGVLATVLADASNATAGHPSAFALNETHTLACDAIVVCDQTSGNIGSGNVRPCAAQEPFPAAGLPQWVAWYAVHVVERRDVFVPQSSPFTTNPQIPAGERHWPLPDIPLPNPGGAPHLCDDDWATAGTVDQALPV